MDCRWSSSVHINRNVPFYSLCRYTQEHAVSARNSLHLYPSIPLYSVCTKIGLQCTVEWHWLAEKLEIDFVLSWNCNATWPDIISDDNVKVYDHCFFPVIEQTCSCRGWKPCASPKKASLAVKPEDPCRQCGHSTDSHVAHLASVDERTLNELFFLVSDVEAIVMLLQRSDDVSTQKMYNNILQLLRKCLSQQQTKPSLESITGVPPYETPTVVTVSWVARLVCPCLVFCLLVNEGVSGGCFFGHFKKWFLD